MKKTHKFALIIAAGLGLTAGSVCATSFNYKYTFANSPLVVSGTLDGVQNGDFVDNVTNVSMFFNGNAISGPIYAAAYTGQFTNTWVNGPIVSFNLLKNDFIFINGDLVGGGAYDTYFWSLNSTVYDNSARSVLTDVVVGYEYYAQLDRWSLTVADNTSSVPESGSTAVMLGLALLGLAGLRRKF